MKKPDRKGPRLVALFLLGCLLFNYPLISLFDRSGTVFGIPVLYAYLLVTWTLFIGLAAIVVATSHSQR
jgi:hypothetical protein